MSENRSDNSKNGKNNRYNKRRRKKKSGYRIFLLFAVMLVVIAGISVIYNIPSVKAVNKVFDGWEGNPINVTVRDMAVTGENAPIMKEGQFVYPISFVKEYIDKTIFWDGKADKLTITNENEVIRMSTDDLTYYINNEPLKLSIPVYKIDNTVYMPESMLKELYNVSCVMNEKGDIIMIDFDKEEQVIGKIKKGGTRIYVEADKKSGVIGRLSKNDEVVIFEESGEFTKIRNADGVPGYVYTKVLVDVQSQKKENTEYSQETKESWKPEKGKINMVWEQVFKLEHSSGDSRKIPIDSLDVISPTWFHIADSEGNINNIADKSYVDWAHAKGYQVWALFSNDFDPQITHDTLSDTNIREKIIKQILAFAALYELDGINIDFESIKTDDGEYYVQFIREITPLLREQGVTVSVDMYIPAPWTSHYNMEEVGKVVDYVCIMAYDEHYATSKVSGSVASMNWVNDAMENTVAKVDPNKVIMGIPFYTRLWEEKTVDGNVEVSASAMGMEKAYKNLKDNNAEIIWNEECGQYYGEYEKDGNTYKIWLEDEKSIEERLKLVEKYNLAGTAGWKRGFEKDEIWTLMKQYLKK